MKPHKSMRGYFAHALYQQMERRDNIIVLLGDLGYGMFDAIRDRYPQRVINCGAAEQAMMDMAVGLAYEGKIPVVYSITPFLIYRPFETIRTYINHENLNVKLVGSGRDKDYKHDGISHWSEDVGDFMKHFENIECCYPAKMEQMYDVVRKMFVKTRPMFISLKR